MITFRDALAVGAILSALAVSAAEQPVIVTTRLADFESAEELAKWEVRASKPKTLWELSAEHASHGKRCAKRSVRWAPAALSSRPWTISP